VLNVSACSPGTPERILATRHPERSLVTRHPERSLVTRHPERSLAPVIPSEARDLLLTFIPFDLLRAKLVWVNARVRAIDGDEAILCVHSCQPITTTICRCYQQSSRPHSAASNASMSVHGALPHYAVGLL